MGLYRQQYCGCLYSEQRDMKERKEWIAFLLGQAAGYRMSILLIAG